MSELLFSSALELAALVRTGEVSSRDLVSASLERIEALDPQLNAFVHVDPEGALAAADAVAPGDSRPFAGVPIAIKDNRAVAGMPLTYACPLFGDFVADYDTNVVRRLREAGFVIVGKTNLPEVGILPVTEPTRHGPTRNPWDTARTPGGSSGGSGAAVAAGIVPIASANDGGGSTRIPAACCGLVGLKPSRGRISSAPELGDSLLVCDGVLSRTVADTAAVLDLLAGPELGDASWAPPPAEPFAVAAAREPGRLKIGFTTQPPIPAPIDATCAAAVADAAELLESLGHEVEEATPPWSVEGVLQLFSVVFGANIALSVDYGALLGGIPPSPDELEPLTWALYERAGDVNAHQFLAAMYQLEAFTRGIVTFCERYDAILTPALAERPVPIGEIDARAPDPMATFARSGQFTPFTAVCNASGQPAISVPLFHGDDGLPTGIQLIGRPLGEATLLALAAQLEQARPWADRRPELALAG